jgi:hypothetical protein
MYEWFMRGAAGRSPNKHPPKVRRWAIYFGNGLLLGCYLRHSTGIIFFLSIFWGISKNEMLSPFVEEKFHLVTCPLPTLSYSLIGFGIKLLND